MAEPENRHRLLTRQIRRNIHSAEIPIEFSHLLDSINEAYLEFDDQRLLLELSLDNVSNELNQRNQELKAKLGQLESTHEKLASSLGIINGILEATGEAIFAFDNNKQLIRLNKAAQQFVDLEDDKAHLPGTQIHDSLEAILLNSTEYRSYQEKLQREPSMQFYGVVVRADYSAYEYHSSPQYAGDQVIGRVWSFRDVTQQKHNEALIKHQAFHDALTGLPNRVLLLDRIEHAISLCHRKKYHLAILFIDLDHFKKVNDTMGHNAGDKLLIEVSHRIKQCLRSHDTLSRFGGDEFVVLIEQLISTHVAVSICNRITEALLMPFDLEGQHFHVSSSIGVSLYPKDSIDANELIRKADLAMYHAKEKGRGIYEFFDVSLERYAQLQLDLENNLRSAIDNESLTVFYQPKVTVSSGRVESAEALLRWFPEDGPMISPASFIPVAERAGMLTQLDHWVLRQACKQIRGWIEKGIAPIAISVNLSAQNFNNHNFVNDVKSILAKAEVPGYLIELEITESMLMENFDTARSYLTTLREAGIKVSIDDFGTGYSSLQYLQQLPIDTIKIDRSFIQKLEEHPDEKSIIDTIISLSHNLNLEVVAEGVEQAVSYDYLKQRDCDYIQGFYFYRPMCAYDLTQLCLHQKTADL